MANPQTQPQSVLAERYVIEREIGRGGMATVYLAQDRKHRRPVAVKILHPHLAANLGSALDPEDPAVLYNMACAYAQLGLLEKALDCLESGTLNGAGHRAWIENDPDLNVLRDHPRFQTILAKI